MPRAASALAASAGASSARARVADRGPVASAAHASASAARARTADGARLRRHGVAFAFHERADRLGERVGDLARERAAIAATRAQQVGGRAVEVDREAGGAERVAARRGEAREERRDDARRARRRCRRSRGSDCPSSFSKTRAPSVTSVPGPFSTQRPRASTASRRARCSRWAIVVPCDSPSSAVASPLCGVRTVAASRVARSSTRPRTA